MIDLKHETASHVPPFNPPFAISQKPSAKEKNGIKAKTTSQSHKSAQLSICDKNRIVISFIVLIWMVNFDARFNNKFRIWTGWLFQLGVESNSASGSESLFDQIAANASLEMKTNVGYSPC